MVMKGTGLTGMKAICMYVGRSEPTVLGLIRHEGLPAKKIKGEWTSDTDMIDAWRRQKISEEAA
jgi:hypothetical protein